MNSCATCAHARLFPNDMTKRICRGSAPQIVVVPTANGAGIQTMFPVVNASDEICGAFKQVITLTKELN